MSIAGFEITPAILLLGVITGTTYGLLAVGLVIVYRASGVVNFAHGSVGSFGAALLGLAVVEGRIPYWLAFLGALAASAAIGGLIDATIVRRLRGAPRVMSVVGTLGIGQVLLISTGAVFSKVTAGSQFPKPPGMPEFHVGGLLVTRSYSAMMLLGPLLVAAVFAFLRFTSVGIGIRAAAANAPTARLVGISPSRMSVLAWSLAGAIAGFTSILVFPTLGFLPVDQLGPSLLLRALAAFVVARMENLWIALIAGVGVGVVETELAYNFQKGGATEALMFGVILVALLLQRTRGSREKDRGSWVALQSWRPVPAALREVWIVKHFPALLAVCGLVAAVAVPVVVSNRTAIILVEIMAFGLVGLSAAIVTGLTGELSLGQFAVAAIGAVVSFQLASRNGNYALALLGAGVVGAIAAAAIGLPALRISGLMLGVTTLSFALMVNRWLLPQSWAFGGGVAPGRPVIGTRALDTSRSYYVYVLIVLVAGIWVARNVRTSGFGRSLIAIRDNEDGARAFTIAASRKKLTAFAVSGFLAGIGGALFGHAAAQLSYRQFPVEASINVAAMAFIGGLSWLLGPILGALYVIGVPAFLPLDSAGLAATSFGWVLLLLYVPGGFAQLIVPLRERGLRAIARRLRIDVEEDAAAVPATTVSLRERAKPDAVAVRLEARKLSKAFGGVQAVRSVSFAVHTGQVVGIIGPNGAGKTTLFDALSGFTKPDTGHVILDGRDITRASPEARGRLGLVRSFQEAALFETLTVVQTIALAYERTSPTRIASAVAGMRRGDRRKLAAAAELAELMGLQAHRDKLCSELSTGTRRIVELACMVAMEPGVLLLDEPSSGIAQRETEALGDVLLAVRAALGATLVVIEHDMPLIVGLANHMLAMAEGAVICEGTPKKVLDDPRVIEAYLGRDERAIARSGPGR